MTTIDEAWLAQAELDYRIAARHGRDGGWCCSSCDESESNIPLLIAEVRRLRADHLSSLGTMVELEQARGYAERLFRSWAPQCVPLPDLLGLLTQIDNYVTGLRVKRCHYCDLPMRKRERTVDGAVVGTYWLCPEGCS